MNPYAIAPLIATIAYIPLLYSTANTRPWRKRHTFFLIFLVSAMAWSLATVYLRGNYTPQDSLNLSKLIIVLFALNAVQFHCFTSSFFPPQKGRWLPFAYISLAVIIALVLVGYIPREVEASGGRIYYDYGPWVVVMAVLLLVIVVRNLYVFFNILKTADNPVLHNQTLTLIISIIVLTVFTLISLLPWGKEYPISHFGNLIVAFILSFAVIRHRLVDIRIVLRRSTAWITLGVIGALSFWLLLIFLHSIFSFDLDFGASIIATVLAMAVAIFI